MRRMLSIVVLVYSLSASPAEAQNIPIASWCATPGMTLCFSLTRFDTQTQVRPLVEYGVFYYAEYAGYLWGDGFTPGNYYRFGMEWLWPTVWGPQPSGQVPNWTGSCSERSTWPRWGCYRDFDRTYYGDTFNYEVRTPEASDVTRLVVYQLDNPDFGPMNTVLDCSPNGTSGTPCVSVPEPSSLMLLGTGLLGMALIRTRRRQA